MANIREYKVEIICHISKDTTYQKTLSATLAVLSFEYIKSMDMLIGRLPGKIFNYRTIMDDVIYPSKYDNNSLVEHYRDLLWGILMDKAFNVSISNIAGYYPIVTTYITTWLLHAQLTGSDSKR